jgi:hypothetical protein
MDDRMTGKSTAVKETNHGHRQRSPHAGNVGAGPDGKMFKPMEIAYSRKK